MKAGQVVNVYFDQDTKKKFEGRFKLIEKCFENEYIETWICNNIERPVEFPGTRVFFKKALPVPQKLAPWENKKMSSQPAKLTIVDEVNEAEDMGETIELHSSPAAYCKHLLRQRKFTDEEIYNTVISKFGEAKFKFRYVGIKRSDLNRGECSDEPIQQIN